KLKLGVRWSMTRDGGTSAVVHDLSEDGLLLETEAPIALGEAITINLPSIGDLAAEVVWNSGHLHGCKFGAKLSKGLVSAALLRSGPVDAVPAPPVGPVLEAIANAPYATRRDSRADGEEEPLSPRAKLLIAVGLTVASWALVGLIVYSLHRLGVY
ncbi:PilZ domain-containing protein, partial [Novosphingobium tardum]